MAIMAIWQLTNNYQNNNSCPHNMAYDPNSLWLSSNVECERINTECVSFYNIFERGSSNQNLSILSK